MLSSTKIPTQNLFGEFLVQKSLTRRELKEELESRFKEPATPNSSVAKSRQRGRSKRRGCIRSVHPAGEANRHLSDEGRRDQDCHECVLITTKLTTRTRVAGPAAGIREAHGEFEPYLGGEGNLVASKPAHNQMAATQQIHVEREKALEELGISVDKDVSRRRDEC